MSWEKTLLEGRRGLRGHVRGTRRCLEARYKIKAIKDVIRQLREVKKTRASIHKIKILKQDLEYYRDRRDEYCTMAGIDI